MRYSSSNRRTLPQVVQVIVRTLMRRFRHKPGADIRTSENDIPPHVQCLFDAIICAFGDELTLEVFMAFVEAQRGKKLRIAHCDMKTGTTGYVLGLPDCDVIFLRSDLPPKRERLVLFHECAHLLLKHIEHITKGCEKLTYDIVVLSPSVTINTWFHNNDYARPGEYEAESFATLMSRVLPVVSTFQDIPELAKAVLGYRRKK
jgi:hypothetical protein